MLENHYNWLSIQGMCDHSTVHGMKEYNFPTGRETPGFVLNLRLKKRSTEDED